MTDDVILGICTDCNYLFFEQPFPERCPGCGSGKRPMSPDLAAERHQQRREGKRLEPVLAKPEVNAIWTKRVKDGLDMLGLLIKDEVDALHKIEGECTDQPANRRLQLEYDAVESRVHTLHEILRRISSVIVAEGDELPAIPGDVDRTVQPKQRQYLGFDIQPVKNTPEGTDRFVWDWKGFGE